MRLTPVLVLAALLLAAELALGGHAHWPGIALALGLVGALGLAFGAKSLGALGLQRPDPEPSPPGEEGGTP
jgi:hypothetical protein